MHANKEFHEHDVVLRTFYLETHPDNRKTI